MGIIDGQENKDLISQKSPDIPIPLKKVMKTLHVGWKHRESPNEVYKQIIAPVGGIKKVELNRNKKYSFDEIKKMSMSAMENIYNKEILASSVIHLGNYQEEIFHNFTDFNKKKNTDFWDFSDKLKIKNSQLRLYLFSTIVKYENSIKVCSSTVTLTDSKQCDISKKTVTKQSYSGTIISFSQPKKKASSSTEINTSSKKT
ncbi:uncharacterized protein LOC112454829 [Temnothorax curvispinosus]|uniref:Uncharacterized protein LOC112454829 n=1 Tax=Temnothorax curvispinosus TaxID=300111 RepID=A0A6J1PR27_9HYME|nr:uncharacterized protein LOC112454829 [Temnothorax curvispinosus]